MSEETKKEAAINVRPVTAEVSLGLLRAIRKELGDYWELLATRAIHQEGKPEAQAYSYDKAQAVRGLEERVTEIIAKAQNRENQKQR